MFCVASILLSAFLFNVFRFFTPGKIYPYYLAIALRNRTTAEQIGKLWKREKLQEPENQDESFEEKKLQSENTDFLFAQKNILLFWITFITPSVICYTMEWLYKGRIKHEEVFDVAHVHETITGVQTILMIYITFVPFYSYRFKCWDKVGLVFHMIAIHIVFIVCPVVAIVHSLSSLTLFRESRAVGWFFTFTLINVMTVIYYCAIIQKLVRGMLQFHRNRKN